jgi:hypothetical protein
MSAVRHIATAATSAVCSFGLVNAMSCGTGAVGVDDCRKIEEARCEAATHCEGDLRVGDAEACKRYYRDHCLHGLAVGQSPGDPTVNRCVSAIEAAGNCAASDSDMSAAECAADSPALAEPADDRIQTACDVVRLPELIPECGFLSEDPVEQPDPGSNGGAAGTAGTAGSGQQAQAGNGGSGGP